MENLENSENALRLPEILDVKAAAPLLDLFIARRGRDLTLDGSGVQRLGAQCVQIILAAEAAWAADQRQLTIETPSSDFVAGLELLGVTSQAIIHRKEH